MRKNKNQEFGSIDCNGKTLHSVAFSGDYRELSNRPSLGSFASKNSLAYSELTGKPTLGSFASKNTLYWSEVANKPDLLKFTYSEGEYHDYSDVGFTVSALGSSQICVVGVGKQSADIDRVCTAYEMVLSRYEYTPTTVMVIALGGTFSWTFDDGSSGEAVLFFATGYYAEDVQQNDYYGSFLAIGPA